MICFDLNKRNFAWGLFLILASLASLNTLANEEKQTERLFAQIDDIKITKQDFDIIYAGAVRHKFYHGKVPEEELLEFRKQVAKDVVEQMLLLREAKAKGLEPDRNAIQESIEKYKARYLNSGQGEKLWGEVKKQLIVQNERRDLLLQLENIIKEVPAPTDKQVSAFYQANPEKFTEPSRDRVSIILLQVAPSAGGDAWNTATAQADELIDMINQNADFAELAKIYSADPSASTGGELGYLHSGMLSEEAENALKETEIGEITEPVILLEGVALFKLNDRTKPLKKNFKEVKERARGLLFRETKDSTWQRYIRAIKNRAKIKVFDESLAQSVLEL